MNEVALDAEVYEALKEKAMSDRIDVIVLGRKLGTASGWDQLDTAYFVFYDFEPVEGVGISANGGLDVDYNEGKFRQWEDGDNPKMTWEADIVETLQRANLPVVDLSNG